MKRFQLIVMVALAAITAAAIWWHFYRSRHTSSAAVTALLSKDTLALVHLPDFNRSRVELHQTDLYQIWTEPAVQDFLQKPSAQIPANEEFKSIIRDCESLQMRDLFLAVTTIESGAWKMVGGFRFKGDPAAADKAVANWKAKLFGQAPDLKQEIVDYHGHQIQADTAGIVRLPTVRDGQWFFFANELDQLKPLLDRADRRISDSNTTLAADETFAAAFKHMPSIYAAFAFARVDQLVEKLMPGEKKSDGEQQDQMAAIRQIRSLCGATSFDGGRIRDAIFVAMPKLLDVGTLTRMSLPVATKDTFLYAAGFLNLTKPLPIPNSPGPVAWMGGLQKVTGALAASGVTLENWNSAFGPELSCVANWPPKAHWPLLFATLPVKNSTKANRILTMITTTSADSTAWTQEEKDGVRYFSTRTGGPLFSVSPTIGLSDRILVAGADSRSVEGAMRRIADGTSDFATSNGFQVAEHAVPAPQQAFAYIDPALIYTRVDATLRPLLFMSAAFLPGIADTIDLNKLPAAETITKHLSPIVMSQRYDEDGYISESVGPVTISEAVVGAGILGGAAAVLYQKQMPGTNPPSIPTVIVAPASPSASPDDSE